MPSFNDLTGIKQWGVLVGAGVLLTIGAYFLEFKSQQEANASAQQTLNAKLQENAELESYRPKLADMDRQVASLKQQLDIERKIVPDEKEAEGFIKMLDAEALKAGIEIRRYTADPIAAKEFYSEAPFELEIDGPYYSVVKFFNQVSKLERIVDISGMLMSSTKKPTDAKTKHTYQYAPNESVVATCVATTFFTHDIQPPAVTPAAARR
jgi:type IV pilus assembly protein PilO